MGRLETIIAEMGTYSMRGLLDASQTIAAEIQGEMIDTEETLKRTFQMMCFYEKHHPCSDTGGWPMYQRQKWLLMALFSHLKKGDASDDVDDCYDAFKKECMETIDGLMFPDEPKIPICYDPDRKVPPSMNDEAVRVLTEDIKKNHDKMEGMCILCKATRAELEARLNK